MIPARFDRDGRLVAPRVAAANPKQYRRKRPKRNKLNPIWSMLYEGIDTARLFGGDSLDCRKLRTEMDFS